MSSSSDECEEICPTPHTNAGKNEHLLPAKSRERYIATYENFITWQNEKNTSSFCEELLMAYFEELANKYKPTSLWAIYSMLKHGLKLNHGVNMEEYVSLSVFLKKLSKGYVCKKAKALTIENVEKFIDEAPEDKYLATKVALILGVTGGFRPQELSKITTNDIENHGELFLIKVPRTKYRIQRSFVIQGKYYNIVKKYQSLRTVKKGVSNRFFQQFRNGKCNAQVIGKNKFGMMPREVAEFLNLPDAKDYTGHSFRKAFTTPDSGAEFNLKKQASKSSVPATYTDESFNDTNAELADQCRFCGQFSKDCIIVSTHIPYLSGHRTTLALNDTSVQLDFNGALPNTVCQDCDTKLQEIADFVKVVKDGQELINGKIKTECEEDNDMTEIDIFIKTEVDTESDAVDSISVSDTVFIKGVSHKIKSDTNQKAKVSKPNVMVQCENDVYIKQEIDEDLESSRLSHSDTHADSGTLSILDELKRTFCEVADETCVNEVSRKKTKISDSETIDYRQTLPRNSN